ncbi:uncharacterized protein BJ212DRAFT_838998 [Suillus subaureus]|uniref:F-box domain-containing protein n=1 Tax=Suillus subaureus TaxID=48587 RepID=A0A9P7EJF9_9AGAM|nr:uncharacterized protein BJ212DRAFT_838998 [Suillus subaureus]KAG1822933.1 hypothetical protein BJ212DRAFT_838998 [Suillus subaureus]
MEPVTQLSFPFGDLPVELALLILKYAAEPSFSQIEPYKSTNPYACALTLCLVSKEVRKTVLPEILHTVLLPQLHNVTAFMDTLRMQQAYAQQDHQFKCDYTKYIRRMWMGQFRGSLPGLSLDGFGPIHTGQDLSPLAPILLAAPCIAVDFENLGLLSGCLFHAWKSRTNNHEGSPALYSPKTLMVTGSEFMTRQWSSFTKTVHGAVFLASISHVISITFTISDNIRHARHLCHSGNGSKVYHKLPDWMAQAPLSSLQTFSLPIPHSAHPLVECEVSGKDMKVELLTFSVSKLSSPPRTLKGIRMIEQMTRSPSNHGPLAVSNPSCIPCQDWLKAWACGLGS